MKYFIPNSFLGTLLPPGAASLNAVRRTASHGAGEPSGIPAFPLSGRYGTSARASISMRAPLGRAATWTVERAGLWPPKAFS